MKNTTKTILIALLVVFAAGSTVPAFGQREGRRPGRGGRRGPGRGLHILRCVRQLDLSDEQQEQISKIRKESREGTQAAGKSVHEAMQKMHQAVIDAADTSTIEAAAAEVGQAMGKEAIARVAVATSIKKVLTEEQLKKLEEIQEKAKQQPKGFGRGRGRGRGYGREDGRGYGRERGKGYGRERGRGYGREDGRGYGRERGRGYGREHDRGYGREHGRGYGPERGRGYGPEHGRGRGRGWDRWEHEERGHDHDEEEMDRPHRRGGHGWYR